MFVSSSPLTAPSTSSSPPGRPPAALVHAGTVRGGHVSCCCRGVMMVVVVMAWRSRHMFGPAPEHGCRVVHVHVHVVVATPGRRRHCTQPRSSRREDGGGGRQTGRQFGRLGEVRNVHVHVDVGLIEAGDGGTIPVHLGGVVQHRSEARHLRHKQTPLTRNHPDVAVTTERREVDTTGSYQTHFVEK